MAHRPTNQATASVPRRPAAKARTQKPRLSEALPVEAQPRVGRDDVVVAEEPQIDDQDRDKPLRPPGDDEAGRDPKEGQP